MKKGRIKHLYLKPAKGEAMVAVMQCLAVEGLGLENDRSFSKNTRQVLIVEDETLKDYGLVPGQIRENLVVENLAISGLPLGARLRSGEVLLEVSGDCAPCEFLNTIKPGLREDIRGRRGVFAVVRSGGTLQIGADISIDPIE